MKKCLVFHIHPDLVLPRPICLQGEVVKVVAAERCLVADVHFSPNAKPSEHVNSRVTKAVRAADRIANLPLSLDLRARLLATQPCAAAFHGIEVTQLTLTQNGALDSILEISKKKVSRF